MRDPDTGRYLVQVFTLSVAPSATSLELLSRPADPVEGESLVLGDPENPLWRLDDARREAELLDMKNPDPAGPLEDTALGCRRRATEWR